MCKRSTSVHTHLIDVNKRGSKAFLLGSLCPVAPVSVMLVYLWSASTLFCLEISPQKYKRVREEF